MKYGSHLTLRALCLAAALTLCLSSLAQAQSRQQILIDTSNAISTYAPWILHDPGWDRYRMYFGRNETINNVAQDRIYLMENMGNGLTGWGTPMVVLSPGGTGQNALIHDPTVLQWNNTWHMYYTGTSDTNGMSNKIFHAVSANGVNWTKRGVLNLNGKPGMLDTGWGYGEPSLVIDGSSVRLYFVCYNDSGNGTVYMAYCSTSPSDNGDYMNYYGHVTTASISSPEVRKKSDGTYILMGTSNWEKILKFTSTSATSFANSWTEVLTKASSGWDSVRIGTPTILPGENRLYYAGTDTYHVSDMMKDADLGVHSVSF